MKLFAFKCKKVLTFGLGSVIIGTVKKRQSEYTYEKGLFPWLYIRGVSTIVGVDCGEGPPVPIPNTEVKLACAEDTRREAARKNK